MFISIANAIGSSSASGKGGAETNDPLTDATFQQAVNDILAQDPVSGDYNLVPYGKLPNWDVSQVTNMQLALCFKIA